jgi:hypothetical protein
VINADDYALLCDVVERAWQHWPVEPHDGLLHTSSYARAAAMRIVEELGLDEEEEEQS